MSCITRLTKNYPILTKKKSLWKECILLHVLHAAVYYQKWQPKLWGIHPPSKLQPVTILAKKKEKERTILHMNLENKYKHKIHKENFFIYIIGKLYAPSGSWTHDLTLHLALTMLEESFELKLIGPSENKFSQQTLIENVWTRVTMSGVKMKSCITSVILIFFISIKRIDKQHDYAIFSQELQGKTHWK